MAVLYLAIAVALRRRSDWLVRSERSSPHRAHAETALALGRYDLALEEALHALRLWNQDPRTDVVLAVPRRRWGTATPP